MWVVTHWTQALADHAPERTDIALEINLSGRSIGDHKLLVHIDSELRHARVAPDWIIFEVTETCESIRNALSSDTEAQAAEQDASEQASAPQAEQHRDAALERPDVAERDPDDAHTQARDAEARGGSGRARRHARGDRRRAQRQARPRS